MQLSILRPKVGGGGAYPREFDVMKLSHGGDFGI